MSVAWEVTPEDVETVLDYHGINYPTDHADDGWERFWNCIDTDEIEDTVLRYSSFEDQCEASYADIEDMLMKGGIIQGVKHWHHS